MIVRTVYFTQRGKETAERLFETLQGQGAPADCTVSGAGPIRYVPEYRAKEQGLTEWTRESMELHLPILFVGACGIAVRHVAPFVSDKMSDSPVLVMDEAGDFVIPILSGHLGGANELARVFAQALKAQPVITTATDVNHTFSVDVFAARNGLAIRNRLGIKEVSSAVLAGRKLTVCIDRERILVDEALPELFEEVPYPGADGADIDILITDEPELDGQARIVLTPRHLVIGMGCRRGVPFENLRALLLRVMEDYGKSEEDVLRELFAVASIDKKADERGLQVLAQYYHVPLCTYSAEQLEAVEGEFASSAFVQSKVGVANVCERSALLTCEGDGELTVRKLTHEGMTLAAAWRRGRIRSWK
ncbi:MAG: cobalamin biosynthesis protein [Lachnospiraceae bacterium]|nr:cobalamin biosynthesis protein [Lachnospiraceae bacterium]